MKKARPGVRRKLGTGISGEGGIYKGKWLNISIKIILISTLKKIHLSPFCQVWCPEISMRIIRYRLRL